MDQIQEYRLKMMEKRRREEQQRLSEQRTNQSSSSSSTTTTTTSSSSQKEPQKAQLNVTSLKADMRREWGEGIHKRKGPGDWFSPQTDEEIQQIISTTAANTTATTLKLHQRTIEEELEVRQERLKVNEDILKKKTEKKLFKEQMEREKMEQLKREREDKRQLIEALRSQAATGKKPLNTAGAAFTKYVDSKAAANVSNRSSLVRPSKLKSSSSSNESDIIYTPNEDEPRTPTSVPCMLQIRMIEGTALRAKFQSEDTLRDVCEYVIQMATGMIPTRQNNSTNEKQYEFIQENYSSGIRLSTAFPRRIFSAKDLDVTIEKAGLCPNGSVIVEKDISSGFILGESQPKYTYSLTENITSIAPWRLKGDDYEEKLAFKERQRQNDIQQNKSEKRARKVDLDRVRRQIEEDKKDRAQMYPKNNA